VETNKVYLIDIVLSGDSRLSLRKQQTKYMDLKIEISRVWKSRNVFIIPIIVGDLGSVPKKLYLYN